MKRRLAWLRATCTILLLLSGGTARAEDADEANPYLVKSLPRATVTLTQALSMVKPPAETLSAKYEVGDRGRLSLSIYVAAHGVRDANRASMEEVSGDPLAAKWSPSTETLRNAFDVSEATTQRRLLAATKLTLLKVARMAMTDQPGRVFSITPAVVAGKAKFIVLVLGPNSQVATMAYDLEDRPPSLTMSPCSVTRCSLRRGGLSRTQRGFGARRVSIFQTRATVAYQQLSIEAGGHLPAKSPSSNTTRYLKITQTKKQRDGDFVIVQTTISASRFCANSSNRSARVRASVPSSRAITSPGLHHRWCRDTAT